MSPNVKNIADETFYECYKLSSVTIPEGVTNIGNCAFFYCRSLTGLSVPQGVKSIGSRAFAGCEGLADKNGFVIVRGVLHCYASDFSAANVPSGVTTVEDYAFAGRQNLQTVDFPLTLEKVGGWAFSGCSSLRAVYYRSPLPPATGTAIYQKCPDGMVSYVSWTPSSDSWCGAQWIHWDPSEEEEDVVIPTVVTNQVFVTVTNYVFVTTTNVTINYVLNSIRPEAAIPASPDSGFVNVITEVKGGCVAVPETWAAGIEGFSDKFGTDFAKALVAKTGKKDGSGSDMCVWQDYVAGTDPTDVNDVFIASIAMVGGVPKIGYTPELCEAEKAKRKYTIWGKIRLQDSDWVEVEMGHESDYNFFKVSVEMR